MLCDSRILDLFALPNNICESLPTLLFTLRRCNLDASLPHQPCNGLCGSSLWFKCSCLTHMRKTSQGSQGNRVKEKKHVQVLWKKLKIAFSLTLVVCLTIICTYNHFSTLVYFRFIFCGVHGLLNGPALLCRLSNPLLCNSVLCPLTQQ